MKGGKHLPKHMGWKYGVIGNLLGNSSETWELFGLTTPHLPNPKKWKANCQPSKWKVNNGQSTFHTKVQKQLEKTNPLLRTHMNKREGLSLHDNPLHFYWLHGNTIPNIGYHHFWLGLITHLLIRTYGYLIMYSIFQKPRTSGQGKKSINHPILKCSPNVIMEREFINLWGHIVKHFSLEFQQLNWVCQVFDVEH